jgi:hypothetical protein
MTTARARNWVPLPPLAALLLVTLLLGACGSAAGSGSPAAASPSAVAAEPACQQVGGALSDGPDPDADPVGYAEAQILPLRQIHTQDKALRAAIGGLADAYQSFFTSNGKSSAAKEAVAVASKKINSLCPGAAS